MVKQKKKMIIFFIVIALLAGCGIYCVLGKALQKTPRSGRHEPYEVWKYYRFLNKDLLGPGDIDLMRGLIWRGICEYSDEVKGDFTPVLTQDSIFPPELITMLEESFYHSSNARSRGEGSAYDEALKALGADDFLVELEDMYELFPRLEAYREEIEEKREEYHYYEPYDLLEELYSVPRNTIVIFHIHLTEQQDNYVFLYQSGGTNGAYSIGLKEKVGDELITISECELQSDSKGRVIQYGQEFYYVYLQLNYDMKFYDGIRIHRLGENPTEETMLIRYLPEEYIWDSLYMEWDEIEDGEVKDELEAYIDLVKKDIGTISNEYLESGYEITEWANEVYYGDEKLTDVELDGLEDKIGRYGPICRMDIANMGLPVYMERHIHVGDTINLREYMEMKFYVYVEETGFVAELEGLGTGEGDLMQMWFKEIGGKVYTFRIYHICDYNYILDIICLEQDKVTPIGRYMIAPKREFIVTEGEIFTTAG